MKKNKLFLKNLFLHDIYFFFDSFDFSFEKKKIQYSYNFQELKSMFTRKQFVKKVFFSNRKYSILFRLITYYLSFCEQNFVQSHKFMIMIDFDALENFNIDGITKAFTYDTNKWDVLTGNCKERYYDIWALRMNKLHGTVAHSKIWKNVLDYDCWDMFWHLKQNIKPRIRIEWIQTLRKRCIGDFQVHIPHNFPLLQVESAFNGVGIYKVSKIL